MIERTRFLSHFVLALAAASAFEGCIREEVVATFAPPDSGVTSDGSAPDGTLLATDDALAGEAAWPPTTGGPPEVVRANVAGVHPQATISGTIAVQLTCALPAPTGLVMYRMTSSFDELLVEVVADGVPFQPREFVMDSHVVADGWHEVRLRCRAQQTVGPEVNEILSVTIAYPVFVTNAGTNPTSDPSLDYVRAHAEFGLDSKSGQEIGFVYSELARASAVRGAPLAGSLSIATRVSTYGSTGPTTARLRIDGTAIATAALAGSSNEREQALDTRAFTNGLHVLVADGEGAGTSARPLRASIETSIATSNAP